MGTHIDIGHAMDVLHDDSQELRLLVRKLGLRSGRGVVGARRHLARGDDEVWV